MDKRPLSSLDEITASSELKQKTLHHVMNKKKTPMRGISFSILALISCILLVILPNLSNSPAPISPLPEEYTFVSMDINPSLELTLDKNDMVIGITSFNEEAQGILDTLDLKEKKIEDAVSLILHQDVFQSYLSDGFLQVSVASKDKDTSTRLENELNDSLSQYLGEAQYGCSHATIEEKEAAQAQHMSFGKYQIVKAILALDTTYTIEDLQDTPMRELMNIYEEISGASYQNTPGHGNREQHKNRNENGKQHKMMNENK